MQAKLEQAKTEFARYSGLFKQKAASAVDVDTWRANLDAAQADLLGAQAKVELAQINLGYTTVTAPFDGRMGRHMVDAGNLVGIGGSATVLAEINRIDPIYAYFTINERQLLQIRAQGGKAGSSGQPDDQVLELGTADEQGFPVKGKLDFAAISLTAGTGTLQLRGIFPNPDFRLLPGPVRADPRTLGRDAGRDPGARGGDRPRPGRPLRPDGGPGRHRRPRRHRAGPDGRRRARGHQGA